MLSWYDSNSVACSVKRLENVSKLEVHKFGENGKVEIGTNIYRINMSSVGARAFSGGINSMFRMRSVPKHS